MSYISLGKEILAYTHLGTKTNPNCFSHGLIREAKLLGSYACNRFHCRDLIRHNYGSWLSCLLSAVVSTSLVGPEVRRAGGQERKMVVR